MHTLADFSILSEGISHGNIAKTRLKTDESQSASVSLPLSTLEQSQTV